MKRQAFVFLLLILALGAFLRFHKISSQSLWDDEISTIDYTAQSISQMWNDLPRRDANPPLFYFVYHYWRRLGDSELAYRALSALLGVLSLPLLLVLARQIAPDRTALLATLLLAFNPLSIYCAQETRAHTLLLALSLASMIFYLRLMDEARAPDLFLWTAFTSLALYTHYFAFFILLVQIVHAAGTLVRTARAAGAWPEPLLHLVTTAVQARSPRLRSEAALWLSAATWSARLAWRRLGYVAAGLVLLAALYVPWLQGLALQLVRGQGWRPYLPPWDLLAETWIYATVGHAPTRLPGFLPPLEGLQDGAPADVFRFNLILLALLVPFLVLFVGGLLSWKGEGYRGRRLVVLWALLPIVALLVVTQKVYLFDPRHILPFLPPMALLAAAGLERLARRPAAFVAVALYVATLPVLSLRQYYDDPAFAKQDWRGAYRLIGDAARPGDAILSYHAKKALGLAYYSDGRLPLDYVVPEEGFPQATSEEVGAMMTARVRAAMDAHPRIWLVDYHGLVFDPGDVVRRTLRERFTLAALHEFQTGPRRYTIELYTSDFEEAAGAFLDHVDFERMDHSPGQILDGWYQHARRSRWMADRASVRLARRADARRVTASFYAYFPFLGPAPFDVTLEVEGRSVGTVRVDREGLFTVAGALPEDLRDERFLLVTLRSAAWFRPGDFLPVKDETRKSLLVLRIGLEP